MSPRGESPQHSESAEASERPTKRAKKLPFFERLSDEERRQLRRKQRLVRVDLEVSQSQETIEQARALNNELFEEVDHTREAVLDAENVEAIASKYQAHAERLVQVSLQNGVTVTVQESYRLILGLRFLDSTLSSLCTSCGPG